MTQGEEALRTQLRAMMEKGERSLRAAKEHMCCHPEGHRPEGSRFMSEGETRYFALQVYTEHQNEILRFAQNDKLKVQDDREGSERAN